MNFIEKMLNIKTSAESEPEMLQAEAQTIPIGETSAVDADAEPQPSVDAQSYSKEDIEELVNSEKAKWKEDETTKQNEFIKHLPEAERLKVENATKDEEIIRLKAELSRFHLEQAIIKDLSAHNLPTEISKLVHYSDEKSTMAHFETVLDTFKISLEKAIKMRFGGKTPSFGTEATIARNPALQMDSYMGSNTDAFARALSGSLKR